MSALIRPTGEKLVYSTRWYDEASDELRVPEGAYPKGYSEADRSDLSSKQRYIALHIVINDKPCGDPLGRHSLQGDERHEALAQRQTLASFLRGPVRSHAGSSPAASISSCPKPKSSSFRMVKPA